MSFGSKIKKIRKSRNMTQKELAELLGVKTITIRKYESNERDPSIKMLKTISKKLNVPIDEFLKDDYFQTFTNQIFDKINQNKTDIDLKLYKLSHWNSSVLFDTIIKYMENTKNYELSLDYSFIDEITDHDTENNKNLITTSEIDKLISNICEFAEFEIYKLKKQKNKKTNN